MQLFFSILIPAYNRPEELENLIDSIINQSFNNYEILVSDDCSPKKIQTKNISKKYIDRQEVRFFFQEQNLGERKNKNFLISKASGKYIILIGDDDLLNDESLSLLFNHINNASECDIYYFGYTLQNILTGRKKEYKLSKSIELNKKALPKEFLFCRQLPLSHFHPSTFCASARFAKTNLYTDESGIGEDLQMYLRVLLNKTKVKILPLSFFTWRKDDIRDQLVRDQTNQSLNKEKNIEARTLIFNNIDRSKDLSAQIEKHLSMDRFISNFLFRSIIFAYKENPREVAQKYLNMHQLEKFTAYQASIRFIPRYFLNILVFFSLINAVGIKDAFIYLGRRLNGN